MIFLNCAAKLTLPGILFGHCFVVATHLTKRVILQGSDFLVEQLGLISVSFLPINMKYWSQGIGNWNREYISCDNKSYNRDKKLQEKNFKFH